MELNASLRFRVLWIIISTQLTLSYFLGKTVERASTPYDIAIPSLCHAKNITGIEQYEIEYYINPDARHPNFRPILNIQFPHLNRSQFRSLQKLYSPCGGKSLVKYQRGKTCYSFLDLLSPIVQATWGHRFEPENKFGPAPLYYQCYGFILDVLSLTQNRRPARILRPWTWWNSGPRMMAREKLTIWAPDSRAAYEALHATTTLVSDDFSVSNDYAERDGIQPGDVIIIYHDNSGRFNKYGVWLDHVAMYVDGGILLEKSGSGPGTTFRLIDYATFDKSWGIGVFLLQVRRPMKAKTISIPIDLTVGGKYSLPVVNNLFKAGGLQWIPSLVGNQRNPGELCGSYDEECEKFSFSLALKPLQPLVWNSSSEHPQRAKLPLEFYEPLDRNHMEDEDDLERKTD